jgi:hypothetical protein
VPASGFVVTRQSKQLRISRAFGAEKSVGATASVMSFGQGGLLRFGDTPEPADARLLASIAKTVGKQFELSVSIQSSQMSLCMKATCSCCCRTKVTVSPRLTCESGSSIVAQRAVLDARRLR